MGGEAVSNRWLSRASLFFARIETTKFQGNYLWQELRHLLVVSIRHSLSLVSTQPPCESFNYARCISR